MWISISAPISHTWIASCLAMASRFHPRWSRYRFAGGQLQLSPWRLESFITPKHLDMHHVVDLLRKLRTAKFCSSISFVHTPWVHDQENTHKENLVREFGNGTTPTRAHKNMCSRTRFAIHSCDVMVIRRSVDHNAWFFSGTSWRFVDEVEWGFSGVIQLPPAYHLHDLHDELCWATLTSYSIWSIGIPTYGLFILKSTVGPMNTTHQLSHVMSPS